LREKGEREKRERERIEREREKIGDDVQHEFGVRNVIVMRRWRGGVSILAQRASSLSSEGGKLPAYSVAHCAVGGADAVNAC